MSIDTRTVTKIARLARIKVTEEEKALFASELSAIFQWIEQLNGVPTDNVPALASVSDVKLPWREDKVTDGNQQEAIIKNAPAGDYGCFVVPKVME